MSSLDRLIALARTRTQDARRRARGRRKRRYWRKRARFWAVKLRHLRALRKSRASREFHPWMLNGHPGKITKPTKAFIVRAVHAKLAVTATSNGQHAAGSFHYTKPLCKASDVAGTRSRMVRFQDEEGKRPARFNELFGPDTFYVKNGQRFPGRFPDHGDHVHGAAKR